VGRPPARPIDAAAEWREIVALAKAERVGALLDQALRGVPELAPVPVRAALAGIYRQAALASLLSRTTRERVCRATVADAGNAAVSSRIELNSGNVSVQVMLVEPILGRACAKPKGLCLRQSWT